MRALRVVGLDEDGETVICEDPENGDRFSVPADERLRAAARGDLTRLGQVQIEMEAQMRPREIQARVRAGASVEEVAAAAGIPEQRVERYAYPVLLERAQIAERSQRAHPVREDGPDVQTLGEVVAHTFGMRGHDLTDASWDAWRGEDGKWVVRLQWQAGRSENRAHWVFHPGAHGGTVAPIDDHAVDLLDPSPNRTLRTVRPVTALAREALGFDEAGQELAEPVEDTAPPAPAKQSLPAIPPLDLEGVVPAPSPEPEPSAPLAEQAGEDDLEAVEDEAARKTEPARRRKNHPMVPSWEDVLLGVRSHR
ncbi:septation protein SepH [Saccharopolyspora sp. MS10]|uniref:septation protein SepH n=1 Tax=Saccharopolyspora sp. MS10 TaxID=3385973 RepID=UPI0039A141FF